MTFSGPTASAAIDGGQRRVDSSAESDNRFLKSAFAHVVAGAKYERRIGAGFITRNLFVHLPGQGLRVEDNEILFERTPLCDDLSFAIENKARPVEEQAVVAAHLIHEYHRNFVLTGDLASMSRRSSRFPIQKGEAEILRTKFPPALINVPRDRRV